jgi:stage V sporulation protein AD
MHTDCGIEIFDGKTQDTHAGGSGCGCAAVTLSAYILKQIEEGRWKKVLFIPTGALLSKTSFNEGKSVPGIAHAIALEAV